MRHFLRFASPAWLPRACGREARRRGLAHRMDGEIALNCAAGSRRPRPKIAPTRPHGNYQTGHKRSQRGAKVSPAMPENGGQHRRVDPYGGPPVGPRSKIPNPKSGSPNPESQIQNPKSQIRNPKPEPKIPNPKSQIRRPKQLK